MHSCKGLEFPHVFIVGLEDGLLPHSRSKVEGTLDEERRLFYVAVTRAMQTLAISHCGGRKKYGQVLPCQPSPFLKELPEELVEHSDSKSKTPVAPESGKDLFAAMRQAVTDDNCWTARESRKAGGRHEPRLKFSWTIVVSDDGVQGTIES